MENKSHALITGLFTLLLGAALVATALWLGRDTTERVAYELTTRASIAGLSAQSSVKFRGLEIGKVESIGFDPQVPGQVLIRIAVNAGTPLTRSTYATLGYQGVTGLAYIQLDDKGDSRELLATKAGAPARIPIAPGMLDMLTVRGEAILVQMEELAKRVNLLLDPANQKVLTDTIASAGVAARGIDKMVRDVQPIIGQLPEVARETRKTLAALTGTAEEYSRIAARVQEKGGLLDRVGTSLDQLVGMGNRLTATLNNSTLPRIQSLVDTIGNTTLPRVNHLIEDGAGTLRNVNRLVDTVGERPQSLLFGPQNIPPGPGEQGFVAPAAAPAPAGAR